MSKARFGTALGAAENLENAQRAIGHLNEAQKIVDTLSRPDIGARLQEVIESLHGLARA